MAAARDLDDGGTPFATETAPTTLPPPLTESIGLIVSVAVAVRTISWDGGPSGLPPAAAMVEVFRRPLPLIVVVGFRRQAAWYKPHTAIRM